MNTFILHNNVTKTYAKLLGLKWHWLKDPSDASAMTKEKAIAVREVLAKIEGPALDGSIDIKDQIAEVKRVHPGSYKDSEDYEDGDDTGTA